jgi:hypothetical protein
VRPPLCRQAALVLIAEELGGARGGGANIVERFAGLPHRCRAAVGPLVPRPAPCGYPLGRRDVRQPVAGGLSGQLLDKFFAFEDDNNGVFTGGVYLANTP